jgi:hypothetical protein
MNPATEWLKIAEANNKMAASIQNVFHNTWLVPCPRPQFIVFDNKSEFKRELIHNI